MNRKVLLGKYLLPLFCVFLALSACSQKEKFNNIVPESIKSTLSQIDSTILTVYDGFALNDETFVPIEPGILQDESNDSRRAIWNNFVNLCANDDFKAAYNLYCSEGVDEDIFMYLINPSWRYSIDKYVLKPMFYEYENEETALKKYIEVLEKEYTVESNLISESGDMNNNIPKVFQDVISELMYSLYFDERIDDAMSMIDDYAFALNGLSGNPAYTNFSITLLLDDLYEAAGDDEGALKLLEDYKVFTSENKDPGKDPEEYEIYITKIDEKISDIKSKCPK